MHLNGKNRKIYLMAENSRTRRPMILKLGMKKQAKELYKVCINHDLFYGKVNLGH